MLLPTSIVVPVSHHKNEMQEWHVQARPSRYCRKARHFAYIRESQSVVCTKINSRIIAAMPPQKPALFSVHSSFVILDSSFFIHTSVGMKIASIICLTVLYFYLKSQTTRTSREEERRKLNRWFNNCSKTEKKQKMFPDVVCPSLHSAWFEHAPIKNTTWTYRLRPLGHECKRCKIVGIIIIVGQNVSWRGEFLVVD